MKNNFQNARSLLISLRQKKGLSQASMAALIGISRDILANYENSRTKIPADVFLKLDIIPTLNPDTTENNLKQGLS